MTDTIISLEVAKLAKEKGFSVGSPNYYNLVHGDLRTSGVGKSGFAPEARPSNSNNTFAIAEAPTQSLLQRWLREQHYVFITVHYEIIGSDEWVFSYRFDYLPKEHWEAKRRCLHFEVKESYQESPGGTYWGGWNTYEEALENALKDSLSLL